MQDSAIKSLEASESYHCSDSKHYQIVKTEVSVDLSDPTSGETTFFSRDVRFDIIFFGDWTRKDKIIIKDNQNKERKSVTINHLIDNFGELCEINKKKITVQSIRFDFPKTSSPSLLTLSKESENQELSFAVENLKIDLLKCPENSEEIKNGDFSCVCKKGYFKLPDIEGFQCSKCPVYCLECDGPFQSNCQVCNDGFFKFDNTCTPDKGKSNFCLNK